MSTTRNYTDDNGRQTTEWAGTGIGGYSWSVLWCGDVVWVMDGGDNWLAKASRSEARDIASALDTDDDGSAYNEACSRIGRALGTMSGAQGLNRAAALALVDDAIRVGIFDADGPMVDMLRARAQAESVTP